MTRIDQPACGTITAGQPWRRACFFRQALIDELAVLRVGRIERAPPPPAAAHRRRAAGLGTLTMRALGKLVRHSRAMHLRRLGRANAGFASGRGDEGFGRLLRIDREPPVRLRSITTIICRRGSTPRKSGSATVPCSERLAKDRQAKLQAAEVPVQHARFAAMPEPALRSCENSVDCSGMLFLSESRLPCMNSWPSAFIRLMARP